MREEFPAEFKERLAFSQMKDPKTMTRWLLEYRKFMLMSFMAQEDTLYPSYQVHQVWQFHIQNTSHYREFCTRVFGRVLMHRPDFGGLAERRNNRVSYEKTLSFYEELFQCAPQEDFWEPVALRFHENNTAHRYVNIYRLSLVLTLDAWIRFDLSLITKTSSGSSAVFKEKVLFRRARKAERKIQRQSLLIERSQRMRREEGSLLEVDQIEVAAEEDYFMQRPREKSIALPSPKTKKDKDKNRHGTHSAAPVAKNSLPNSMPLL